MKVEIIFDDCIKISAAHRSKIRKVIKTVVAAVDSSEYVDISAIQDNFKKAAFVSVTITDDENIRIINKDNRDIDKATDVLSFPYLDFINGKYSGDVNSVEVNDSIVILGDIIISLDTAMRQATEYGHSNDREIGFLICHSMLHLYGYDHMIEAEYERMNEITEDILTKCGYTRTGDK